MIKAIILDIDGTLNNATTLKQSKKTSAEKQRSFLFDDSGPESLVNWGQKC